MVTQLPEGTEVPRQEVTVSGKDDHPNEQNQWDSGSNIRKEEYLSLRVLWSYKERLDPNSRTILGLDTPFKMATQWLQRFPPFSAYPSLHSPERPQSLESSFAQTIADLGNLKSTWLYPWGLMTLENILMPPIDD
ncbi:hypothetical protein N7471_001303 [Penicillium samsonianum]|uniref:uncharacterized protein n=1 Tax=Penicillium samsonianum TaxID=1882272 RepID=UPI002547E119|nr:uncharacterized protein N7471_001303 [Penicillium samsonianum]KAJ6150104.1 hypothetical protein N7471_001303 [Penicillium samsonianum]